MYFAGIQSSQGGKSESSERGSAEIGRNKLPKSQHRYRGNHTTKLSLFMTLVIFSKRAFICFYQGTSNEEERAISFPVPGASDCLHSSDNCIQFQIKKDGNKERWSKSKEYFSTLPLDTDTSECSSVYTSEKLNFLWNGGLELKSWREKYYAQVIYVIL